MPGEEAQLEATATGGFVEPTAFAARFFGAQDIVTFPLTQIATPTVLAATALNIFGMDFGPNGGVLYGIDNGGNLVTIDQATGATTML